MREEWCSPLRRRECAVCAFTVSVFAVIAWSSVSHEPPLAAAPGLQAWISQQNWVRNLSVAQSVRWPVDKGYTAMGRQANWRTASAGVAETLPDPVSQPTAAAETAAGSPERDISDQTPDLTSVSDVVPDAPHVTDSLPKPVSQPTAADETADGPPEPAAPGRTADAASIPEGAPDAPHAAEPLPKPVSQPTPADGAATGPPEPGAPAQTHDPASKSEVMPDAQHAADPRWLTGPGADLRKCLKDDRDGDPATVEGVLAGELPRYSALHRAPASYPPPFGISPPGVAAVMSMCEAARQLVYPCVPLSLRTAEHALCTQHRTPPKSNQQPHRLRVTPVACRFKVEATFNSSHPGPGLLTLTTYVNMDRLNFLEGLCASWEGPLIAAAYLPLIVGQPSNLDSDVQSLRAAFDMCADLGARLYSTSQTPSPSTQFVVSLSEQQTMLSAARKLQCAESACPGRLPQVEHTCEHLRDGFASQGEGIGCRVRVTLKIGLGHCPTNVGLGASYSKLTCCWSARSLTVVLSNNSLVRQFLAEFLAMRDGFERALCGAVRTPQANAARRASSLGVCRAGHCWRRIDARTDGCQLDMVVYSELVADEEVRP